MPAHAAGLGKAVQVDIIVDPGLKALGFQPVESTCLSKFWFQMSTCTPTPGHICEDGPRRRVGEAALRVS